MELLKFTDNLRKRSTYVVILASTFSDTLFEGTLTELSHSVWFTKYLHKEVMGIRFINNKYYIYIEEL